MGLSGKHQPGSVHFIESRLNGRYRGSKLEGVPAT